MDISVDEFQKLTSVYRNATIFGDLPRINDKWGHSLQAEPIFEMRPRLKQTYTGEIENIIVGVKFTELSEGKILRSVTISPEQLFQYESVITTLLDVLPELLLANKAAAKKSGDKV